MSGADTERRTHFPSRPEAGAKAADGPEPQIWRLMVDGECEKRYFDHLMRLICARGDLAPVDIRSEITTHPRSFVRDLLRTMDPEGEDDETIYCVADVEGDHPHQIRLFERRLADLRDASGMQPGVRFQLAYSNCDFDLWMILHKLDFYRTVTHKGQYLRPLQDAYGGIRSLAHYKRRRTFERVLRQIGLADVGAAIRRADTITRHRALEGPPLKYCGYTFYPKNPSLSVGDLVRKILSGAGFKV